MFATFRNTAVGAALGLCAGVAVPAQAAYIVTLQEVGANVVATGSGSIDLAGLNSLSIGSAGARIIPSIGQIITGEPNTGPSPIDRYTGFIGPTSFGSGGLTFADSGSGDFVGVSAIVNILVVPPSYSSNNPLSDITTYLNQSFTTLGVTPGTYVWTWGTGADADSFALQIGAVATAPEPASLALFGAGLAGLGMVLRTRRT